jgi:hypothetical protein
MRKHSKEGCQETCTCNDENANTLKVDAKSQRNETIGHQTPPKRVMVTGTERSAAGKSKKVNKTTSRTPGRDKPLEGRKVTGTKTGPAVKNKKLS